MNKEEIINKNFTAVELDFFRDRQGSLLKAMDEFAKQQTVSFTNWTTSAECDYSCSDEDEWNNIHNPHETITSEQLYDKFILWQIEQQNKP